MQVAALPTTARGIVQVNGKSTSKSGLKFGNGSVGPSNANCDPAGQPSVSR